MIIPINQYYTNLDFSGSPKRDLTYSEFLNTTKVIRMLYGVESAKKYFTDNLELYYNKDNA